MKNTVVLIVAVFFMSISYGQQDTQTGPKAKNEKAWNKESKAVTVHHSPDREAVTGPKAKNNKAWDKEKTAKEPVTRKEKTDVTGPRYKNSKPWKKQ